VEFTSPVTMHSWRSRGTIKVLLGTLESPYCGPSGCAVPSEHLDVNVTLALHPTSMGQRGAAGVATWRLRCLDGAGADRVATGAVGGWVRFPVYLEPGEGHAYELEAMHDVVE
jgi:hypothetical protein